MGIKVTKPKGNQRATDSSPTGKKALDGRTKAAKATGKKK